MALRKTKTLPSGISGNYWRILTTNIHHDRDGVVDVVLYADSEIRKNYKPLYSYTFDLGKEWLDQLVPPSAPEDVQTLRDLLLKAAYIRLSEMSIAEAQKESGDYAKNEDLAWFADAEVC